LADSCIVLQRVMPDKVWTMSIECQINEHDFGDYFLVDDT
jgi:hypothetical protein